MEFRTQQPDPKPLISQATFSASVEYHHNEISKLEKQIAEHTAKMLQLMRITQNTAS